MRGMDFSDSIQMVRVGGPLGRFGKNIIEVNKFATKVFSDAREKAKRDTCFLCDKPCSSFCNSHSIPEFTLRKIAQKGKVIATLQDEIPTLGKDTGVNKAGTFHIICHDCDNKVFKEYETPDAYTKIPTDKMLAQIALKDHLRMISRRHVENEFYKILGERFPNHKNFTDEKQFIGENDLRDYLQSYNYAKKATQKSTGSYYYLCFHAILDYVVPFAAQSPIVMICDFEGNVINDIYNFSPDYKTESIHVAVFPLETQSVVMMFIEQGKKRYRKFYKQLQKLSLEEQLAAINYIIFAYTENVFLSIDVAEKMQKNHRFMDTCRMTTDYQATTLFGDPLVTAVKNFSLSNRNTIPNLLSKEYAIR